VVDDFSRYT
jgi:transposase InsO family protein